MLLGETLSLVFGISNLVIWFGIAIPQIYKNYKNNSSKAISYLFYYKLLIGGIISLCIALIKMTNITVIYIGIHHLVITSILMTQLLYYRIKDRYILIPTTESDTDQETDQEQEQRILGPIEWATTLVVTPNALFLLWIVYMTRDVLLIEILAWIANILFTTSKFSQIYTNYLRGSTRGLSKFSFVSMIFTDIFFLLSILINVVDIDEGDLSDKFRYIALKNLQWICSCSVSLFSCFIILFQFYYYRKT
jgi:uncharacterized protein with PQ loop repeat